MEQTRKSNSIWMLVPILGIIIFVILYIIGAFLYPGGSQADVHSVGYSWVNNYWCNLLSEKAINGQPNPARNFALTGMAVLCLALSFFWIQFPRHINISMSGKRTIQFAGLAAMIVAMFIFTAYHDIVVNLSGFFALIALPGTFVGLYKNNWRGLFYFGIFNLLLMGLNNYLYHTDGLIVYLPVVQKFSFLSFLIWFSLINFRMYQDRKNVLE